MKSQDEALEIAKQIKNDAENNLGEIVSEEDSKIQLINRFFIEVLDWPLQSFRCERKLNEGYADYALYDHDKPCLIVEAKRTGKIEVQTVEKSKVRQLVIKGPALKKAKEGIEQAVSYAPPIGIQVAVLTDGFTWIIFKSFIPETDYRDKEAIVFPSLEALIHDFHLFYELLHINSFRNRLYNAIFDEVHNNRLLLTQQLYCPTSNAKLLQSSQLAQDLADILGTYFDRISSDKDEDMLIECFVETRESRIADFSLEKMTTAVLRNVVHSDKDVDSELAKLIKENVEVEPNPLESGQTIFIVGPTGAGKSTFLDRFFRKTLSGPIREKCLLLQINCLDSTGTDDNALAWVRDKLIKLIESQLYTAGSPSWEQLQGLYFDEYERRRRGYDKKLYIKDKEEFQLKFSTWLEEHIENDKEGYLRRLLSRAVKGEKLLPILLIDNTDEFGSTYKQKVFQFCQALRREAKHCIVILPVTDKSAWSFSKLDIFSQYESKSFFLPTPSPREVFKKRIDFLKLRLSGIPEGTHEKGRYKTNTGIEIAIQDVTKFAEVLESVFVDNDFTSKTIGEIANYNIRRTLLLSKRVITSPVFRLEDLIKSFITGNFSQITFNRFMDALLKGPYDTYKEGDCYEISPIFKVDNKIKQSPLTALRILALLNSAFKGSTEVEDRHLQIQSILGYFDSIGCSEASILSSLKALLDASLIEPFDPSSQGLGQDQKLAISFKGSAHYRLALNNNAFFVQMALTTPITNEETAEEIRRFHESSIDFSEKTEKIRTAFVDYLLNEDSYHFSETPLSEAFNSQRHMIDVLTKFKSTVADEQSEISASLGENFIIGIIKKSVLATVDWFDHKQAYGFVEVEGTEDRVFIHRDSLRKSNIDSISNGDILLCDLARGQKGLYIDKIHAIEESPSETVAAQVIRLFKERGYGFVKVENSDKTAFFHYSIFDEDQKKELHHGKKLNVIIAPDKNGTGYLVKSLAETSKRRGTLTI